MQKNDADAQSNRALSLLTLGDLTEGFRQYEWRWKRGGMTDTPTLVTLSLGGTSLSAQNVGVDQLIGCADQALYQAKHNGRNQVRLWTDPLPAPSPERRSA